jgi:DNA-binding transcriptional regulator YhcF (GntR family)
MRYEITLDHKDKMPKHKQIVHAISRDIERGALKKNFHLPSINQLSSNCYISRDTIDKAYKELKSEGYITSIPGKGYFVIGKKDVRLKVLLILNDLTTHKKVLYDTITQALGADTKLDLQIHHYDPKLLKEIIESNLGNYHYYVIMPHFFNNVKTSDYIDILKSIPPNELIILDKVIPELGDNLVGVFQDFPGDIYSALSSMTDVLAGYQHIKIIYPKHCHYPLEIIQGAQKYCTDMRIDFSVISRVDTETLHEGALYIVLTEDELAQLIKGIRKSNYELGKQIGIICFNESVLKELLDITVITTDFLKMGRSVANLMLKNQKKQIKNPFNIIMRSSVQG